MSRSDSINMDRPWTFHLPKGILWVVVEGLLLTIAILVGHDVRKASAFAKVRNNGQANISLVIWALRETQCTSTLVTSSS